jgi:predicted protein tyrosine phosphatase
MTKPHAPQIHVCSLSAVPEMAARTGASHLITLLGPGPTADTPPHIAPENHLRLTFNDINHPQEGLIHPAEEHVAAVLAMARAWDRGLAAKTAPLLIHCWAGISRSTASALISACALRPDIEERTFALALRAASSTATPNARMIAMADAMLGRNGRLIAAAAAIGPGELSTEARPFSLTLA